MSHSIVTMGNQFAVNRACIIIFIINFITLLMENCFSFKVNPLVARGLLVCNVSCCYDFEMLFDTLLPILTPQLILLHVQFGLKTECSSLE